MTNPQVTIKSHFQKAARDWVASLPSNLRAAAQAELDRRFESLLGGGAEVGPDGFLDMIGFGKTGVQPLDALPPPYIKADFDENVSTSQLQAVADLYFIFQHEKMKVFQVVNVLRRLFELGRIKVHRGPGARALYLADKWEPLRYAARDRRMAYRRCFNYGSGPAPAGAYLNKNFHYQFVAFTAALAQYFRDLTIGEVIRGSAALQDHPFGSIATIQRLGTDLRYALDRSSYGNILSLTQESGHYLRWCLDLLDAADIKKGFDAVTKWDVLEAVSNQHLGGARELSQRARMAESGRQLLQWIADSDFSVSMDAELFRNETRTIGAHAEAWIAAYRLTDEGRRFPGVTTQLQMAVGLPGRQRGIS